MATPSIGAQMACVVGFLVMSLLLAPLMSLVAPGTFTASYFGANGLLANVNSTYSTGFSSPIVATGNNNTIGFGVLGQGLSQTFSLLSFVYGGLIIIWKAMTNMPTLLIMILVDSTSNIAFVPIAMGEIITIIAVGYCIVGDLMKLASVWSKSDIENVGS